VFVALVIQHAKRLGRFILSSVIEHKMCVLILSTTLSETFLILRRIQRDIIINVHRSSCKVPVIPVRFIQRDIITNVQRSSCKVPVIPVRFQRNFNSLDRFLEKYSNMKFNEHPSSENRVVPCGQTDGRTDRHDEASSLLPKFCKLA
jgi:hypothetical protein